MYEKLIHIVFIRHILICYFDSDNIRGIPREKFIYPILSLNYPKNYWIRIWESEIHIWSKLNQRVFRIYEFSFLAYDDHYTCDESQTTRYHNITTLMFFLVRCRGGSNTKMLWDKRNQKPLPRYWKYFNML